MRAMPDSRSCNEVESAVAKAAVAAGYPAGLAADIGAAAVLLCIGGYNGVGAALHAVRGGLAAVAAPRREGAALCFGEVSVAAAGMGAAELLVVAHRSGKSGEQRCVRFAAADSPLLLLGLLAVAARAYNTAYKITGEDGGVCIVPAADGALSSGGIALERAQALTLEIYDGADTAAIPDRAHRIEVPDGDWQQLEKLVRQTYVAASDESRQQGAGAGLTDND